MRIIHDWKAKRSSATMTIEGVDLDGAPVRVVGIVTIEAGTVWPVATDLDGAEYELRQSQYRPTQGAANAADVRAPMVA